MIHSLNTNSAHSSGDASDVAHSPEYQIETYKAGYWTWTVRDVRNNLLAYGGYCWSRRKARKDALAWIKEELNPGPSEVELRDKRIKDRTMRKETYRG